MKPVRLFVFVLLSSVATGGWAHEPESPEPPVPPIRETAGELLKACAATALTARGRLRLRYCYGFLAGVEETMRLMLAGKDGLCTPPATTTRELARIFVVYATARQDLLRLPAVEVAARALRERFPCKS